MLLSELSDWNLMWNEMEALVVLISRHQTRNKRSKQGIDCDLSICKWPDANPNIFWVFFFLHLVSRVFHAELIRFFLSTKNQHYFGCLTGECLGPFCSHTNVNIKSKWSTHPYYFCDHIISVRKFKMAWKPNPVLCHSFHTDPTLPSEPQGGGE